MFFFMYAVSDWLCVVVHFDRDREIPSISTSLKEHHYLFSPASTAPLSLSTYLYPARSPLTLPLHNFPVTVKKSFNMPAFINHSTVLPLGARNSLSVHMPAFPTSRSVCASSLSLCTQSFIHLSLLFDFYVFAPPRLIIVVCEEKNMNCC